MATESDLTLISGPWDHDRVSEHLANRVLPIRIGSTGRSFPLVQSVWYSFDGSRLWCCTQEDSLLAKRLRRNPVCGFEVAADDPPYRGVRGHGVAQFHPEMARGILPGLIEKYLGDGDSSLARWLRSRVDDEVAIAIGELNVASWDYTERMT